MKCVLFFIYIQQNSTTIAIGIFTFTHAFLRHYARISWSTETTEKILFSALDSLTDRISRFDTKEIIVGQYFETHFGVKEIFVMTTNFSVKLRKGVFLSIICFRKIVFFTWVMGVWIYGIHVFDNLDLRSCNSSI